MQQIEQFNGRLSQRHCTINIFLITQTLTTIAVPIYLSSQKTNLNNETSRNKLFKLRMHIQILLFAFLIAHLPSPCVTSIKNR